MLLLEEQQQQQKDPPSVVVPMEKAQVDDGGGGKGGGDVAVLESQQDGVVVVVVEKSDPKPPVNDSFPIVYKRRYTKGGEVCSTDPKTPRPPSSSILPNECKSADQAGLGKNRVMLQRKGSSAVGAGGAVQKQSTLEQFWKQPQGTTKPTVNGTLADDDNNVVEKAVQCAVVVLETDNCIANPAITESPNKRKRVEQSLPVVEQSLCLPVEPSPDVEGQSLHVEEEGGTELEYVGANANEKKQGKKTRGVCKGDQNQNAEQVSEAPPAGDVVISKKRKVGRPRKDEAGKRNGNVEKKYIRPAKRPKLVLGANCKLEVEEGLGGVTKAGLSMVAGTEISKEPSQVEVRKIAGGHVESQERGAKPAGRSIQEASSSETQTDDDLPERIGRRQIRQQQQQEQNSSEATKSETATETDPDLPCMGAEKWAKQRRVEEDDEETDDGDRIPIDLNVLPELLMNSKPRRKKRAEGVQRNGIQKPKRPALKRVEIHQQLQPLNQSRKAVQPTNQIVKSLWPIRRNSDSHVARIEEKAVDPITSNSGRFVSLKHLRSPVAPSQQSTVCNGGEEARLRASAQRTSDPASMVCRIKIVQPKVPRVSPGKTSQISRLTNLEPSMPVLLPSIGVDGSVEKVTLSSSEETESDVEQTNGRSKGMASRRSLMPGTQSVGGLTNGNSSKNKVCGVLHLKRPGTTGSVIDLTRSGCPPLSSRAIRDNLYPGSPGKVQDNNNASQQQWQGTPKAQDQGRKGLRAPDTSEDSETESDTNVSEIPRHGVKRVFHSTQLQKPPHGGVIEQNGHRGKGSGVLKARVAGSAEGLKDTKSPSNSPLSDYVKSVGSIPKKSTESGLHVKHSESNAPTTKKHPRGAILSTMSRGTRFMKAPHARMAIAVQKKKETTRFSLSALEKNKKAKKTGKFGVRAPEGAILIEEEHDSINDSKDIPKAVLESSNAGLHTPLLRSPAPKEKSHHESISVATPEAGMDVKQRTKLSGGKSPGENGDMGEVNGAISAYKMTPRTRKLTDAMQKFVTQKANRRIWREIDLSAVHPTALIGRTCKVFWPLDEEWYPGVIHDYNPQTKKHRIDYQDDEMEMVFISKERVKLKLSPEEWVDLETSTCEQSRKPDPDELAALAAGVEDHQGQLGHGDLVWAKVKGYPMWPAFVMDEEHAEACGMEPARKGMLPLQFFGSYDFCRFSAKKVVVFSKGLIMKFHNKCKRVVFEQGLEEVERYLKECQLPDSMVHLLDDSVGDGVHGAIERQRQEIEENWPEPDEQDFRGEGKKRTVRKGVKRILTFPLHLGALTIVSLGKVVRDTEHFHDQQYIWPEGYTAVRKFTSTRDPEVSVDYKMQVLRNPCTPSLPMFRVTPEDEPPIEGPSPFACWKKFFQKLRKAQEKSGKSSSPDLDKPKQFRSAAHMFGFSNPRVSKLIQALPNARACTKFTNWTVKLPAEEVEPVLPAGYKPVNIAWKHLDRCTVCYLDEEYTDNLLLQCDKCRIMVHMNCYGELELPDGDLWLCNLCRSEAPKSRPPCCLCPVTGGVLKKTTDGRWAHLMCAMWIPETCLVDVKRMEPVDGINAISKERWRLNCSICKVPYGACIQCTVNNCRVAFHPLCARSAGLCMEVLEEKRKGDGDTDLRLLAYCRKHKQPTSNTCEVINPPQEVKTDCLSYQPPKNPSGCARSEPYNAAARRGRREPEALAAALAKRLFVENLPHRVTGCRQNRPPKEIVPRTGGSLWSLHWEATKEGGPSGPTTLQTTKSGEVLSMSEKFRKMRSSLNQRLVFGKSAIHGMGVFTKQFHDANDMIIEYAGEVVRPIIADIRERRCYDSLVGAGTYMFRIDDERVVDATHTGSIAHLINHSCEPNCYSRTVTASGEDRIIIFAKRDIQVGEELTYDYRFMSRDELLTCYCGCTGCRGSVNVFDGEGDPTKLFVPLSELVKLPATTRGHTH